MTNKKVPYIIGDIHGCFDEYLGLEELIKKHASNHSWEPYFVSVGDLIDRGKQSKQVVEHYYQGFKKNTHFLVLGNHEYDFLRFIHSFRPDLIENTGQIFPDLFFTIEQDFRNGRFSFHGTSDVEDFKHFLLSTWYQHGGRETMESYASDPDKPESWKIPKEHILFLMNAPFFWMNENIIITHGLATSDNFATLQRVYKENSLCSKKLMNLDEDELFEVKKAAFSMLWNRYTPELRQFENRTHVSGHTPLDQVRIAKKRGFVQIDTACVYGKKLTAYCQEDEKILAVDSKTFWKSK